MRKKIAVVSAFILIYSVIVFATFTYSKYRNTVEGDTSFNIASWNIIVNTETINDRLTLTNDITPIFDANPNIRDTVLAPGSTGYYDITIDSTDVDVAFAFDVVCANSADSTIPDLIVTGYTIDPDNNAVVTPYATSIAGNIAFDQTSEKVRVFIEWDDSAAASMDNIADTAAVIDVNAKAVITNTMTFTQTQN